jgi:CDP-diacylglycerol--serine O-phosphatidyltransferase
MADLVSFGLFSMAMVFSVFQLIISGSEGSWFSDLSVIQKIQIISLLIIPLLSALRLARFNLQEQSDYFVGLPVPAFALFWAGIYYDMHVNQSFFGQDLNPWFLWAIVMVMSLMMVVPLPMLSLKFTSLSFRKNFASYILLIAALIILAFTGIAGLPLVILTYILLSLLKILLT